MEEYEITWREVLFSTIIISFMVALGIWISNPIMGSVTENAIETISAVKVKDAEKFSYIARTNSGNFYAEGNMTAVDPVSIPEISGKYLKIIKNKEEYRRHVQVYTTTDGKGHTSVHTRVYHSWDVVDEQTYVSKYVFFLGQKFNLNNIKYYINTDYKETQKSSVFSNTRYVYYTHPTSIKGVMNGFCDNKTYKNLSFSRNETIESVVKSAYKSIDIAPICFWIIWMSFTIGIIFVFYAFKNEWLDD